jgi:uncharacterized membrane protein YfcA/uncharacterized membrane protein
MRSPTTSGKFAQDAAVGPQGDLIISSILRGGVLLSVVVILVGIAGVYISLPRAALPATFPDTLPAVLSGSLQGNPLAIVILGLLILLATPLARVTVSIAAFAIERDRLYIIITSIVLTILLFGIFGVGAWLGQPEPIIQHATPSFAFLLIASVAAGFIGALVGLGGGVFIVPILTLMFHTGFPTAIGASIVSIIATSSGAAAAYVRDGLTNLRLGMFLEIATTLGAICGTLLSTVLGSGVLSIVFGLVLLGSVIPLVMRLGEELPTGVVNHKWAERLRLSASYPDRRTRQLVPYNVAHVAGGFGMMCGAGMVSGLLGAGSGVFKVLAMDTAMRLPMKVSTSTSNFMIGVTAAASAGMFFQRGDIDPTIAAPVALGVLLGAMIGAKVLVRMPNAWVRKLFIPVIVLVAVSMLAHGAARL